ncbi:hypothetical protein [Ruminococcus callidus]
MGKLEEQKQDTAQDADKNFPTDSGVPYGKNGCQISCDPKCHQPKQAKA